jgi:hypothetical protein
MALTANDVVTRVEFLLSDADNVHWTVPEVVGYINDAQLELVAVRPDAASRTVAVQLIAGVKQALPTGGIFLLDVIRNMGTDGTTAGAAVRPTTMASLAAFLPSWAAATASAVVKHYMYSKADPLTFYVYPPQPATSRGYVEMLYAATPDAIPTATPSTNLSVADIYFPAIVAYVLFRCWSKDSEIAGNAQQAAAYYAQFQSILGVKTAGEATVGGDHG